MPPARKPRWERRPRRSHVLMPSVVSRGAAWMQAEEQLDDPGWSQIPATVTMLAAKRQRLYARLLWLDDYKPLLAAEREESAALLAELMSTFISDRTRRLIKSGTPQGQAALQAAEQRLGDVASFLRRSRNRKDVPLSQAMKGIVNIAAGVKRAVWDADRKQQRVVGYQYATELLREMVACRPPPPFEVQDPCTIASIAFDQTYARSSGSTGISSYNPIQSVDAQGNPIHVERMVYINGQHLPAPLRATNLSDGARAVITAVGPYTQDFARVLPKLDPRRLDGVMDGFVRRTVALLGGMPPPSTRAAMRQLLSRPAIDPGGATYVEFMPPLPWVDTKSYLDMIRILEWATTFLGTVPLVLQLIGDGQSCLRLRDLKRQHPALYKHVIVGNGHMHSGAHSQFADVFLWWKCLLCTCMVIIGKVVIAADGTITGTVRPDIKDLRANSAEHTQQGLLPVAVAIIVFFTTRVTNPNRALFFADPVAYLAQIENAGGIVLAEFLRHVGIPTLMWQRGTRAQEAETLDDLHCLALHKFRCAHKTSSSQISLLHLIGAYCSHPELRPYLRARLFVALTPRLGAAVGTDKSLECQNEVQKERNIGPALLQMLSYTQLLQPLHHVYRMWKIAMGTLASGGDGVRASMENEVDALVRLFEQKLGTDLVMRTEDNPFWHTGNLINLRAAANLKQGRPWEWIWAVAEGRSSGHNVRDDQNASRESWIVWARRHIRDHMFYM